MIFVELHIGYPKDVSHNELLQLLQRNNMKIINYEEMQTDCKYLQITTDMLEKRGLVCFGLINRLNTEKLDAFIKETRKGIPNFEKFWNKRKELLDNSKALILEDARFWIAFIYEFVNKFGYLELFGTHPSIKEDLIRVDIKLSDFTQDDLLNMQLNQLLAFTKD